MNASAQEFARILKGQPEIDPRGGQVHRTIKLWGSISSDVEVLVSNTSISRNEIMNRLMQIGIEELKNALGSDFSLFFDCLDEDHAKTVTRLAYEDEK